MNAVVCMQAFHCPKELCTCPSIIIDIYPGSSTHPKVVFSEVLYLIEFEFGNVDF